VLACSKQGTFLCLLDSSCRFRGSSFSSHCKPHVLKSMSPYRQKAGTVFFDWFGDSECYASDAIQDPIKEPKDLCKQDTSSDHGHCCWSIRSFCQEGSRKLIELERFVGWSGHSPWWTDWCCVFFHMKGPCYLLVNTLSFSSRFLSIWSNFGHVSISCQISTGNLNLVTLERNYQGWLRGDNRVHPVILLPVYLVYLGALFKALFRYI